MNEMLVIRVGFFLLLVMGCGNEDTATKAGSDQTGACLDIANELIDIMTDCETTDQSWQSCESKISDKKNAVEECLAELEEERTEKENDELKQACEKQLQDDFMPIEKKLKEIRTKIELKDCNKKESEELKKACTEELEGHPSNIVTKKKARN